MYAQIIKESMSQLAIYALAIYALAPYTIINVQKKLPRRTIIFTLQQTMYCLTSACMFLDPV